MQIGSCQRKENVYITRSLVFTKGHITLLRMRSIRLATTLPPTTNTSMLQCLDYQGWCDVQLLQQRRDHLASVISDIKQFVTFMVGYTSHSNQCSFIRWM